MTMKIQLDSSALAALFPPGSEAEAELRRVVVHALLQKIAIKDLKLMDDKMRKDAEQFIRTQVANQAGAGDAWRGIALSAPLQNSMRRHAAELVDKEVKNIFGELTPKLQERLENRANILVNQVINDELNTRVNAAIDLAISRRDLSGTIAADTIKQHVRDALKGL